MKKIYLFLAVFTVICQFSYSQTYQWAKGNSIAIISNPDYAVFPSTSDNSGNLIMGSILSNREVNGTAYYGDVIIKKYNSAGAQILSKTFTGKVNISGVKTDLNDNIYVYGRFMDTLRIDPVNFMLNTGSGLNVNFFIIKLNSSGNPVWMKNINVLYGSNAILSIANVKGNFLYAGLMETNFSGSVKKFDLGGNEISSFAQIPVRTISAIDADASGNIFTAGSCAQGNVLFSNVNINCPHVYSLYFAKYNSSNQNAWVNLVADVTFESPQLICSPDGNIYAAGDLNSNFLFGSIQTSGPQWVYDFYLAKMNPAGNFLWVKEVPNNGPITGDAKLGVSSALNIDAGNNVYITGFQRGSVNWGTVTTTSAGSTDALVLKFAPNGSLVWGKTAGNANNERGDAISLDNSGSVYVTGNFGPVTVFDTITINGSGYINSFASKLTNPVLGVTTISSNIPAAFSLSNYPNPFNPSTKIRFDVPTANLTLSGAKGLNVRLIIYNTQGREVETLVSNILKPGTYEVEFNASNLSSGVYFYKMEIPGEYSVTNKMILVK